LKNYGKKNINKVYFNKNITNIKQTKLNFSNTFLPLSTNEIYYGKSLQFEKDKSGQFVSSLKIDDTDLIYEIRKEYLQNNKPFESFSVNTRFYLYEIK